MAGDDRWRYDDRSRGGEDRDAFESTRRYETGGEGTRRREADETFGRGSHDYPAGSFGRGRRGGAYRDENRYRDPYGGERDYGQGRDRGYGSGRFESRHEDDDRRSATEMAFGRGYGSEPSDYRPGDFGRNYDRDHRGFLERAGDEIASWFGDDAERRHRPYPGRDQASGDYRGRGPKSYQRSDDRIREDVNDRLTDDPRLDASHIEVTVASREVTLSGTVRTRLDKRRAEDIADSVSGVTHVQNNLRVQNAGETWSEHQQRSEASAGAPTGAARTTTAGPLDPGEPDQGGFGAKIP